MSDAVPKLNLNFFMSGVKKVASPTEHNPFTIYQLHLKDGLLVLYGLNSDNKLTTPASNRTGEGFIKIIGCSNKKDVTTIFKNLPRDLYAHTNPTEIVKLNQMLTAKHTPGAHTPDPKSVTALTAAIEALDEACGKTLQSQVKTPTH